MASSKTPVSLPEVNFSDWGPIRYLHLGTEWVQGSMKLDAPFEIELEYVQRMMAWMLWRPQDEVDQGHAVQLGLGAASITRFTHKVMRMRTTAVELNPTVISACRMWFQLPAEWRNVHGAWANDVTFVVSPQSYTEGLVWKAIHTHPPAAKQPGYGSWALPPVTTGDTP